MNIILHPSHLPYRLVMLLSFLLAACSPAPAPARFMPEFTTRPATEAPPQPMNTPSPAERTETPQSTLQPRTLTICMGAEPDTLFVYLGGMHAKSNVL